MYDGGGEIQACEIDAVAVDPHDNKPDQSVPEPDNCAENEDIDHNGKGKGWAIQQEFALDHPQRGRREELSDKAQEKHSCRAGLVDDWNGQRRGQRKYDEAEPSADEATNRREAEDVELEWDDLIVLCPHGERIEKQAEERHGLPERP